MVLPCGGMSFETRRPALPPLVAPALVATVVGVLSAPPVRRRLPRERDGAAGL